MLKALIFGSNGQVGRELMVSLPSTVKAVFLNRAECDICDVQQVQQQIETHLPDVVVNATAYTKVDQAESEVTQAYAINRDGIKLMGEICAQRGIKLLHISTDFVFDGKVNEAYQPDSACHPLSIYGASKRAGEEALASIEGLNYLIVRTAWVYSGRGKNFVTTMLRLMQSRDEISVVNNQLGTPTWANSLARWIWQVIELTQWPSTIYHWTDAGAASWYDFAYAINELAVQEGLLSNTINIIPIPDYEYPTPAKRPKFSILNTQSAQQLSGITATHWMTNLRTMLKALNAPH